MNTNSSCLKGLVQALEHEKLITVLKVYKDSCVVKVTTGITTIEVLPHFQQTKKSQLAVWRQKFLPRGKGHLIISTNKGMMSDSTAEQKQLGGNLGDKTKVTRYEEKETRKKDECIPYCLQFRSFKAHERYHSEINKKLDKEKTNKQ